MTISDVLQLLQLRDSIVEVRPELGPLLSEAQGPLITIDLPDKKADSRPRVVVARFNAKRMLVWTIVGHAGGAGFVTTAWPTSIGTAELRDATLAIYDACVSSRMPDSPWRWNQTMFTPVVRVADALADAGVQVDRVVSTNRFIEDDDLGPDEKYEWVPSPIGDALRILTNWGSVTLAHREGLGWVLDTSDQDNTWRIDLGEFATGDRSDAPGFVTEDTARIVEAVQRLVESGELPWNPLKFPRDPLAFAPIESHGAAGRWLHAMGFSTVAAPEYEGDTWDGPFQVVTDAKSWSLSGLKVAYANATVVGKRLAVFSEAGFSPPAEKWASAASIPLFSWPPTHDRISPRSSAAEVLMPGVL